MTFFFLFSFVLVVRIGYFVLPSLSLLPVPVVFLCFFSSFVPFLLSQSVFFYCVFVFNKPLDKILFLLFHNNDYRYAVHYVFYVLPMVSMFYVYTDFYKYLIMNFLIRNYHYDRYY